ncbi:signal recognition particle protein Srp19 [archaeon]|jgi:signal recognition particle subunit SEC65|nr:signal recognition particle protein Srp19 [archaeon]
MKKISKERYFILYPHYFDKKLPRSLGRRIPYNLATDFPSKDQIVSVLRSLGLKFEIQDNVAYPRLPNKKSFRVLVFTPGKKQSTIKLIASKLKEFSGDNKT